MANGKLRSSCRRGEILGLRPHDGQPHTPGPRLRRLARANENRWHAEVTSRLVARTGARRSPTSRRGAGPFARLTKRPIERVRVPALHHLQACTRRSAPSWTMTSTRTRAGRLRESERHDGLHTLGGPEGQKGQAPVDERGSEVLPRRPASIAKKAAGCFRTSRSIRSSRTSFRRRVNSSRSAVVGPVLP